MANNFRAIRDKLLELEAEANAIPVKTQEAKQELFMILRGIENIEFHVGRAEKHEAVR